MAQPRWLSGMTVRWTDAKGRRIAVEELVFRVLRGQMLLPPSKRNNLLILGILARAQAHYDFEIYTMGFQTNHGHYMISVRSPAQRALIMQFIHGNLPKEIGVHGDYGARGEDRVVRCSKGKVQIRKGFKWRSKMMGRRGTPIPIATDAQLIERFKYVTAQGTKDGQYSSPTLAVHVNAGRALWLGDCTMTGVWIDRTKLAALRAKHGQNVPERDAATTYEIKLAKLPTLRHLSDNNYRDFCRDVIGEIEVEAREKFGADFRYPSAKSLRNIDPRLCVELDGSPAPAIFSEDPELTKEFLAARKVFRAAYKVAHHALKESIRTGRKFDGEFPPGCIRPTDLLCA